MNDNLKHYNALLHDIKQRVRQGQLRASLSANAVYTGPMEIAHFGGENTGQLENEYYTSPSFTEVGFRLGHSFDFKKIKTGIEVFGGVKNVFDAYQDDFDLGKNRDSDYIYGPGMPRTFFVGLKLKSI